MIARTILRRKIDERGVALVTALLMVAITLAIAIAVLFMITRGASVSSLTRQYHTALEAGYGAAEFTGSELIQKIVSGAAPSNYGGTVAYNISNACLLSKLAPTGGASSPANWLGGCGDTSLNLGPANSDFQISLAGVASKANFNVFVKIVESTQGNSNISGIDLDSGAPVAASADNPSGPPHPYTYRIEILAQRANNPDERASLTGLYAY